jgi:hypothetical protein
MSQIALSWRTKMGFIAASYGAILAFAAAAIVGRHYEALRNPNDFNGGMAAAGDWMLALFIGVLLLFPTFLLALALRQQERSSVSFAKALFILSLTGPLSAALLLIPAVSQTDNLAGWVCGSRLLLSPVVLVGLVGCRLLVKYRPAKRLLTWALPIELGALALIVLVFVFHK